MQFGYKTLPHRARGRSEYGGRNDAGAPPALSFGTSGLQHVVTLAQAGSGKLRRAGDVSITQRSDSAGDVRGPVGPRVYAAGSTRVVSLSDLGKILPVPPPP